MLNACKWRPFRALAIAATAMTLAAAPAFATAGEQDGQKGVLDLNAKMQQKLNAKLNGQLGADDSLDQELDAKLSERVNKKNAEVNAELDEQSKSLTAADRANEEKEDNKKAEQQKGDAAATR